ncbi:MAG: type I secretion C-terminal target domain-containing protein [Desulfovibrionales bacterium]|nr:type I secretion C-terminal target domain-containing protein [Desulfovibrionales bacterium]
MDDASDEPDETFSLSATLSTGQNDAGQATILDNDEPADDQPTVKSFTHTLVEDGDAYDVSGDALSGSSLGNGTAMEHAFVWTTAPTAAQYGTVTLNPDGTYSYTLDNTNPEVDALQANQQLTETFLYTYTDTDGDEATGSVTITITGANDAPVVYPDTNWAMDATTPGGENEHILAVGNVLVSSPHSGAPDGLDRGDVKDQDVDATDTLSVIQIRLGNAGADLPVQSATTFEDGTIIQGLYGTLSIGADGSYVYVVDFDHPDVNRLNVGEHLLDVFTYTATDGSLPRETTLSIAVFGTDDPPVFSPAIETWVPLDSTQTTPGYELGYPITLDIQDVDSSFGIRFIASLPDGDAQADGRLVYYENGESVDVTAGTVFEYEAIPQIYYIPPAGVELTSTYLDSVSYEIVDSDSGMVSGTGIVNIHAVPPAAIAGPTAQIGDGTNPLNSGSDQKFTITFANDTGMNFINSLQNNLDDAHLTMYTDFQVAPFTVPVDAGSQDGLFLEQQVQVRLEIDGQTFLVKNASAMDSDTWAYDSETGLMKAVVDFDDIMLAFDNDPNKNKDDWQVDPHGEGPGNTLTLAEYLTAHPASPTDTWILIYNDTTGGSEQARFVSFAFSANQEGDDSVVVTGTSGLPNFIFGSDTGNDILTGADMDDTIIGRGGNDTLSGQGGDDILLGGAGSDTFRYTAGDVGDGHDTIMDFHVAPLDAEGDVLDFTGGLTGATLDNISSFLEFRNISQNPDGSTKADLFVDQNGSAGGTDFASIATVHMTGVGDAESGTEILNAMIENNSIKIA